MMKNVTFLYRERVAKPTQKVDLSDPSIRDKVIPKNDFTRGSIAFWRKHLARYMVDANTDEEAHKMAAKEFRADFPNMPLSDILGVHIADATQEDLDYYENGDVTPPDDSWKDELTSPEGKFTFRELEKMANDDKTARNIEDNKELQRKSKFKKYAHSSEFADKNDMMIAKREKLLQDILSKFPDEDSFDKNPLTQEDWNKLVSALLSSHKQELYEQLVKDAEEFWPAQTDLPEEERQKGLAREKLYIKYMFGVKDKGQWTKNRTADILTVRDIATIWGTSHVYVLKVQKQAMEKLLRQVGKFAHYPLKIKSLEQALEILERVDAGEDNWDDLMK